MKKRRAYRARSVKRVNWKEVGQGHGKQGVHVGFDVGKEAILTVLRWGEEQFERPWLAKNPGEIRELVGLLVRIHGERPLMLAMEPTGTYGDGLRQALAEAGLALRRAGSSGLGLAPRLCRLALRVLSRQQDLPQHVQVAAQNGQLEVAAEPSFASITTTRQSVAALQGVDGRLDSRMPLPRLAERDRGLRFLFQGLVRPGHRHARVGHDLGQFPLVLRRVGPCRKRGAFVP